MIGSKSKGFPVNVNFLWRGKFLNVFDKKWLTIGGDAIDKHGVKQIIDDFCIEHTFALVYCARH